MLLEGAGLEQLRDPGWCEGFAWACFESPLEEMEAMFATFGRTSDRLGERALNEFNLALAKYQPFCLALSHVHAIRDKASPWHRREHAATPSNLCLACLRHL